MIFEGTCSGISYKGYTFALRLGPHSSGGESQKRGRGSSVWGASWPTVSESKDGNTYIENPKGGTRQRLASKGHSDWSALEIPNPRLDETLENI